MRSTEYSFFVLLSFLGSLGQKFNTITELINCTDSIIKEMGSKSTITTMTKYNIINELAKNKVIILHKEKRHKTSSTLSPRVEDFIIKMVLEGVEVENNEKEKQEN